jgi:hypothetical protein
LSLSSSRHAYTDCYALLDAALADPRGIRAEVPSLANATRLRLRIHQARAIDRTENAKTYPEDHPLYNRSPYDGLVCRIEGGDRCWVYLDKVQVEIGAVEPIPEGHQYQAVEAPKPVLRIEYRPEPGTTTSSLPQLQIRRR